MRKNAARKNPRLKSSKSTYLPGVAKPGNDYENAYRTNPFDKTRAYKKPLLSETKNGQVFSLRSYRIEGTTRTVKKDQARDDDNQKNERGERTIPRRSPQRAGIPPERSRSI
jgi:hypothetical protein